MPFLLSVLAVFEQPGGVENSPDPANYRATEEVLEPSLEENVASELLTSTGGDGSAPADGEGVDVEDESGNGDASRDFNHGVGAALGAAFGLDLHFYF